MEVSLTFQRNERLKSEKRISQLFRQGSSLMAYPIRVVWLNNLPNAQQATVQIAISVPKRVFKTAVARNRIKRQIREAWRLNKHLFYENLMQQELQIAMMLIYIAKEPLSFQEIENGIKKLIRKFPYTG